jgi:hypothetical protein
VFDHPNNPRHPAPGYVIDHWIDKEDLQFVYTNPGILYQNGMTLLPGEKLLLKYKIWIHEQTNFEEIEKKYKEYYLNAEGACPAVPARRAKNAKIIK